MQEEITNPTIIKFLQKQNFSAGLFDRLKIRYRSLICPFISLIKMVKPGDRVGDVGCGSGQFLLLLSEFAKPSYLFGIEIMPRLIENANQLFKSVPAVNHKFEVYDGINFPQELGEMDVIFLIDVLHHVPKSNLEVFLKNLSAILKPGARLVLKDINAASAFVYFNKLHDLIFAGEIGNEIPVKKAANILRQYGFEIIEQTQRLMYVYPHYTIVAKKR